MNLATEEDYYKVLGVSESSSARDIKIAYRRLALQFHPDKNRDEAASDIFKNVCAAYATLSDQTSRRRYDLSRPATSVFRASRW